MRFSLFGILALAGVASAAPVQVSERGTPGDLGKTVKDTTYKLGNVVAGLNPATGGAVGGLLGSLLGPFTAGGLGSTVKVAGSDVGTTVAHLPKNDGLVGEVVKALLGP